MSKKNKTKRNAGNATLKKTEEGRKKHLAAKIPGEFKPDFVYLDGTFFGGMPKEFDALYKQNLSPDERWKREHELIDKLDKETANQRANFALYYCEGGDECPFADFKGEVLKIENNRILFKRIWMYYNLGDYECTDREGVEDHVWIYDCKPFKDKHITVGTCCKFNACAYAYKRENGSTDFGLKRPENIEIISRYELPDMGKVAIRDQIRAMQLLVCETCMFTRQCYEKGSPICIAPDGYRETQASRLFYASQNNYKAVLDLLKKAIHLPDQAYLGVYAKPVNDNRDGLIVTYCYNDEELSMNDIILEIDGKTVCAGDNPDAYVKDKKSGDTIVIKRSALGIEQPDEVKHTLIDRNQMYDMLLWTIPLDEIAKMADTVAHKKVG